MSVSAYIEPLKEAKMTVEGALSQLKEDKSNLEEVAALYGLTDLTDEEREAIVKSENLSATLVQLLSTRANLGYTTGGHTGDDVFLYAYGPNKPTGLVENTELAQIMARTMGFDLEDVTNTLYIEAQTALTSKGFEVTIDKSNVNNPVLVATKDNVTYKLAENKNTIVKEIKDNSKLNKVVTVSGVTVYNDTNFYISQEALAVIE